MLGELDRDAAAVLDRGVGTAADVVGGLGDLPVQRGNASAGVGRRLRSAVIGANAEIGRGVQFANARNSRLLL
jgi:hypothetical protein